MSDVDDRQRESAEETTPLLAAQPPPTRRITPLPKLQIAVILVLQVCEPLCSQSIYPYINRLIGELDIIGGDKRKVGYYAGLIESLFFATEALTVLQWSRLSDHTGRKPVLLVGLMGMGVSMLLFGLSRTLPTLIVSRCLTGLLNGNIGVMKSVMGELTDSSNRAEGFSLMPVVWGIGATMGPLMGGSLSNPHERFPDVFRGWFWKQYPYFLPCLATSTFVFISFIITVVIFKETNPRRKRHSSIECSHGQKSVPTNSKLLRLRDILTAPVVLSVANYAVLAFLNITLGALLPLFLSMPVDLGGLDFGPPAIGYLIGSAGAFSGIFQAFFFARIVRFVGERNLFLLSMCTFPLMFLAMPSMNIVARSWGPASFGVWSLLMLLVVLLALMDMAYGAIFMFVTASAPNKQSLGATNGLSQTTVSIFRAIGPAISTSLFSFSIQNDIIGGYGVYGLFIALSVLALVLAAKLPLKVWDHQDIEVDSVVQE